MKRLLPWLVVGLLVGCHAPDPGPMGDVRLETFRSVLVERGEVGSDKEVPLASRFSAKINTMLPEGTLVKPGDVVVRLDDEDARDQYERQHLRLVQYQVQLPLTREKGRLDVWRLKLEREQARIDLASRKLELNQLVSVRDAAQIVDAAQTLGALKAERKTLVDTLPEARQLHEKGYISDIDFRQMTRRLAEIDAQSAATRVKLKALEAGPHREEVGLERLKLEEAATALAGADQRLRSGLVGARLDLEAAQRGLARGREADVYRKKLLDAATIKTPAAGLVIYQQIWTGSAMTKVKEGDSVEEGTRVVVVADPNRQVVRAQVNDADAARLTVGMPVRCHFDAYPGLELPGQVDDIAAVAAARLDSDLNHLQAIDVRVRLAHPDARLRPGMSANLEFVLAEQPTRLLVPTQAIYHGARGDAVFALERPTGWRKAWAWLVGPRLERRAVKLGPSNERETVVTDGLSAGDRLTLDPNRQVTP